jgi:DNA-directed RNA polymerase subunit RPC12/RpoP
VAAAAPSLSLQCDNCGAMLQVEAGHRTAKCPYCASPTVVERPPTQGDAPTFALGFVVTNERALEMARKWKRSTWFTPTNFKQGDVKETRGVYVPAYLYTAAAHVDYSAQIGENYTVVETYTTTDSKGNTVTRTRTRTETEWRSLSGRWCAYVDDVVVTASKGLHNDELEAVEPFDLRALRRYTPKILSGWIAEDPSIAAPQCRESAKAEAVEKIGRRLAAFMPGDSHRALQYTTTLLHEDQELVLLPVWVLAIPYEKDKPPVRVVINGQTGRLTGRPPRSALKITIFIVSILAGIGLVVLLLSLMS